MVPSALVVVDDWPITTNGKVDRRALPAADTSLLQQTYIAPRTEIEHVLWEIWQEILDLEKVGVTDNFFTIGGHSLLATRLAAKIVDRLGSELTLRAIFSQPVLEQQAKAIEKIQYLKKYNKAREELDVKSTGML